MATISTLMIKVFDILVMLSTYILEPQLEEPVSAPPCIDQKRTETRRVANCDQSTLDRMWRGGARAAHGRGGLERVLTVWCGSAALVSASTARTGVALPTRARREGSLPRSGIWWCL